MTTFPSLGQAAKRTLEQRETATTDTQPDVEDLQTHGYAAGTYSCMCSRCAKEYVGAKRSYICKKCATHLFNVENKKKATSIDNLRQMRAKIDEILDEETQRAADLVMAAIAILGEVKLMPQASLGRGQFVFVLAPEVYDEIRKRSKDLPPKGKINGKG